MIFGMKKVYRIWKQSKRFFHRYINGTKGAISLFLALVMTPILSVSLLLVESARYQNAVELMEELMDTSAFSVLADYDSYLEERFGLLATAQQTDVNKAFKDILKENADALGKNITLNQAAASAKYPLSDDSILKQQLMEFGEVSVAAEIISEGIDLDKMIDDLKELTKVDKIEEQVEAVNAGIEVTSEIEKLLSNIIEIQDKYNNNYTPALDAYEKAYQDFESKAVALAAALKTAEDNLEEGDEADDVYEDQSVKDALEELKKSRDSYKTAATTLKDALETLKEKIEAVLEAAEALPEKLKKFNEKNSSSDLASQCTTTTYDWLLIISNQIIASFRSTAGADFSDECASDIQELQAQITKLGELEDKTVKSDWTSEKVNTEYGAIKIKSIKNSLGQQLQDLINQLNSQSTVNSDGMNQLGNLLEIANQLLGVSGLYDANLNATVSESAMYQDSNMSLASQMSIASVTSLIQSIETFKNSAENGNIFKLIVSLGLLLKAVAEFLGAIITWAVSFGVNLISFVARGPQAWYEDLLLYGYGAYCMPNRTNYPDGKSINGYSYDKIYQSAGGVAKKPTLSKSLSEFTNLAVGTGNDPMFKGAEAEYLLVGSNSELQNQSVTFFNLYMLRLLLDVGVVLTNPQVSSITALAGPFAIALKIAIVIAEPLLDTIILVNGGDVYISKKDFKGRSTVYLSYSGLVILMQDIKDITAISDPLKKKISDTITAANGEPPEYGLFDASYTEHLILLMIVGVQPTDFVNRLQNIIQMESAVKYKDEYPFKLDKTSTYLYTDVKYTLNPLFNIDGLTNSGVFTAESRQYTGY